MWDKSREKCSSLTRECRLLFCRSWLLMPACLSCWETSIENTFCLLWGIDPPRHWDIFLSVFHRGDVIQLPGARKFREKDITGEKHAMLATVAGLAFYGDARSCRRTRINSWPFSLIPHEIFWTFYPLAITVCYYKWGYFLSCILFCRKFFIPFFVIAQMRFLEVLCNFCCLTNY